MIVRQFMYDLGGPRRVAEELGLTPSTVWSWVQKEKVPAWRVGRLAELAAKKGVPLPERLGA